MKILAIDSSGLVASAAIVDDSATIAEYTVNFKKTHSETLLPMVDAIVSMTGLSLADISAIAVTKGPGSFTGLRIGAATAKGLALALSLPIIGIPTTEALAFNLWGVSDVVCPLMDARRGQTYTGLYRFEGETIVVEQEAEAVALEEIIGRINQMGEPVIFLGDGVPVFAEKIEELCRVPWRLAAQQMNRQRAASVGTLAFTYYKEGRTESGDDFAPEYLRLSQAERERIEKEKNRAKESSSHKEEAMA